MTEQARYCPSCGGEFRPEIASCPECEQTLLSAEEMQRRFPEEHHDIGPAVTVLATPDLGILELARSMLTEEGIGCSVRNERMLGLFPALQSASAATQRFRTAELQVTERNAARARQILSGIEDAEIVSEPELDGD